MGKNNTRKRKNSKGWISLAPMASNGLANIFGGSKKRPAKKLSIKDLEGYQENHAN